MEACRIVRAAPWIAALGMALVVESGWSGSLANDADAAGGESMHGELDGRKFVGIFASDAEGGGRPDAITFRDGAFWSANCVPCGFVPATYWVRKVGDEIHFRGEMSSATSGQFFYRGVVRGRRLSATIDWHKERWYWSIERRFQFEGELVDEPVVTTVADVIRRARRASIEPEPDAYCPL